jgi:hypothetical protein
MFMLRLVLKDLVRASNATQIGPVIKGEGKATIAGNHCSEGMKAGSEKQLRMIA